mmetsp:Transcript_18943/g.39926  ORF Transcript_18943/g.39926 Transcript_18943/m.39926 type:complete len:86 (+) Transcript_18943:359-616(+)
MKIVAMKIVSMLVFAHTCNAAEGSLKGVERKLCPEGKCLPPQGAREGGCADVVQCFVNPCEAPDLPCEPGDCETNYCGGCHAVCM